MKDHLLKRNDVCKISLADKFQHEDIMAFKLHSRKGCECKFYCYMPSYVTTNDSCELISQLEKCLAEPFFFFSAFGAELWASKPFRKLRHHQVGFKKTIGTSHHQGCAADIFFNYFWSEVPMPLDLSYIIRLYGAGGGYRNLIAQYISIVRVI